MVRFLLVLSVKETLCDVYIVRQESDVAGVKAISENTSILFVCPPKFYISIVFVFSKDHCKSQEKLETMLRTAKFGGTNKEYYGIFRSGLLNSLVSDTNNCNCRSRVPLFTSGLSKSSFNTGADWDPGFCMKPPPGKSIFHLFS